MGPHNGSANALVADSWLVKRLSHSLYRILPKDAISRHYCSKAAKPKSDFGFVSLSIPLRSSPQGGRGGGPSLLQAPSKQRSILEFLSLQALTSRRAIRFPFIPLLRSELRPKRAKGKPIHPLQAPSNAEEQIVLPSHRSLQAPSKRASEERSLRLLAHEQEPFCLRAGERKYAHGGQS
jgi:hypothetical protein